MITLRIKYDDTTVGIQFPCSDSVIASKLMELHASDHEGDPFFVEEVIEPKELTKFFEHRFVDLDETNYLAKRMESFLPSEMLQFYGAALQEGHLTVKDLINTTFNLGRYTLIRDLTDMHKVGVTHTLNVKGAITPEEQNSPFMETVGKDLMQRKRNPHGIRSRIYKRRTRVCRGIRRNYLPRVLLQRFCCHRISLLLRQERMPLSSRRRFGDRQSIAKTRM